MGHSAEPPPAGPGWGPRRAGDGSLGEGERRADRQLLQLQRGARLGRCAGGPEASRVLPLRTAKPAFTAATHKSQYKARNSVLGFLFFFFHPSLDWIR